MIYGDAEEVKMHDGIPFCFTKIEPSSLVLERLALCNY
jgi:hypothetical protein